MTDTTSRRAERATGWAVATVTGAVAFLVGGVLAVTVPVAVEPAAWLSAAGALLLAAGPVGVLRSGWAGSGRVPAAGAALGSGGWLLIALGYAVTAVVGTEAVALYATGTGLAFAGMLVLGVRVLRAEGLDPLRRWTPLVCALYLVPTSPFFGSDGIADDLAVAGWMVPWLLLGLGLLGPRSA